MFTTSKLAPALSKAVAGRSGAELAAVATALAAAAATAMANKSSTSEDTKQTSPQQHPHDSSSRLHSLYSLAPTTACEASSMVHQHRPLSTGRFSRLARRRTIQKMKESSTKGVTLHSQYQVETQPLGEGAFGSVYVGRHRQSGEYVAVKKIPKQYTSSINFQNEMEALMHIRSHGGHPNICGLRENFEEGDYYYLVLDLVSGGEMFDHLCNNGPYSEADAARLVREVASALAFQHGIGLVHGDLVSIKNSLGVLCDELWR